jgi:nitric oxide reductase large subunit
MSWFMFGSMGRTREHLDKGKYFFLNIVSNLFFVRVLVFLNGIRMFSSKSINVEAILVVLVVYLSYSCDICLNG